MEHVESSVESLRCQTSPSALFETVSLVLLETGMHTPACLSMSFQKDSPVFNSHLPVQLFGYHLCAYMSVFFMWDRKIYIQIHIHILRLVQQALLPEEPPYWNVF